MLKLDEKQLHHIAEELECGMSVYLNLETKEIVTLLDSDDDFTLDDELLEDADADLDPWKEDRQKIITNPDNYLEFEEMSSDESYRAMLEFTTAVKDEELRKKLELGLSLSRPFRNFKDIIGTTVVEEKEWFAFKHSRYIESIRNQIERYNDYPDGDDVE